jgi:hypothetical protein
VDVSPIAARGYTGPGGIRIVAKGCFLSLTPNGGLGESIGLHASDAKALRQE